METLDQQLASLSPDQRRLVEHWLRQEQLAAVEPPRSSSIPCRRTTDTAPLSFVQQRLWFLHQLAPDSPAYNMRIAVRLVGSLDVAVLERSLNEVVRRHETFRTTFASEDGHLWQVIAPTLHLRLPLIELDHVPPAEREAQLQHLMPVETEQPFDLAHGPLLRVLLLRLAPDEHVLLLTMHHIISDGWSQGILLGELMALYAAFAQGKPSPLPELPIQYADYASWQRQWFEEPMVAEQLAFWKGQLERTPDMLDLPTDRPRPAVATYHGSWIYFTFPPPLLDQLKGLSRSAEVTLFMTLLAAFGTLLYRYTGQTDIIVGTPVAGRNRSELEGLIGCFMNTLALRTNLSGNPTFRELLQRVRTVMLEAFAHQDVPFEKVLEELHLERDPSQNPIFQVMLALQNVPRPALSGAGLTLLPMEVNSTSSMLDLSLFVREQEPDLLIRVEYNIDLFDAATIRRVLGHFRMLLEGIGADPDQHLCALPLLTEDEWQQLAPVEEVLADLWADMLGLERVGIHDNFFDLGGDPSKAGQMVTRMRETLRANLPMRSLFEMPTVAAMAELIVARESRPGQTEKIARMLKRIRDMPAEDRQKMLEQKRRTRDQEGSEDI